MRRRDGILLAAGGAAGLAADDLLWGWRWPVLAALVVVIVLASRRRVPTREEIRASQERDIMLVEAQLAQGRDPVIVHGHPMSREAAWAATTSIRKAWEHGGRYDGQELASDGIHWFARIELPSGDVIRAGIGRFPEPRVPSKARARGVV